MQDWDRLRSTLDAAGIGGTEDLGRFVNNTNHFAPSTFDAKSARPILLGILPTLTDPRTTSTVAMYLQEPKLGPEAFALLREAFEFWARKDQTDAGWQLGIAVVRNAQSDSLPVLLDLATRTEFGRSRQMIVEALWRWRKDPTVAPVLAHLCEDPDVCLHAMSAYRRAVGNDEAIRLFTSLEGHLDQRVQVQARRARRKAERAVRAAG